MPEDIFNLLPHTIRRTLFALRWKHRYRRIQNQRFVVTDSGYSLKPFDQKKCIFVHIPKTGGVSVCKSIFGNLAGGHRTIQDYQLVFSKKEFNHYFKFTFVRNPWDRVFSAYNFLKKGGMIEKDRKWAEENLAAYETFDDFIKKWLNPDNIKKYPHFIPQYEFLCPPNGNKLLVDFTGFFENIKNDFNYIKEKLSLDATVNLPHENATAYDERHSDYRNLYTHETRAIVEAVYKKDIEILGYNFDNSSLTTQLKHRSN